MGHLELLDPAERETLEGRLRAILRERDLDKLLADLLNPRLRGKVARIDGLEFEAVSWGRDGKGKALQYDSTYFRLVTNAGGEVADVLVYHLEQIYAAYAQYFVKFVKGYEGAGSKIGEGVRFGLVVAIMVDGFAVVWNYVTEPIAFRLGVLQLIEHVGEFGVYGAIVGLIYEPRVPRARHRACPG